jgi:hypothetical protein
MRGDERKCEVRREEEGKRGREVMREEEECSRDDR